MIREDGGPLASLATRLGVTNFELRVTITITIALWPAADARMSGVHPALSLQHVASGSSQRISRHVASSPDDAGAVGAAHCGSLTVD